MSYQDDDYLNDAEEYYDDQSEPIEIDNDANIGKYEFIMKRYNYITFWINNTTRTTIGRSSLITMKFRNIIKPQYEKRMVIY